MLSLKLNKLVNREFLNPNFTFNFNNSSIKNNFLKNSMFKARFSNKKITTSNFKLNLSSHQKQTNKQIFNINKKTFHIILNMEKVFTTEINNEIVHINYSLLNNIENILNNSELFDSNEITNLTKSTKDNVIEINDNIVLTTTEKRIFKFIIDVLDKHKLETVCRVAGGWIRDKLLGNSSDDIDIALDNTTGEEFAKLIHKEISLLDKEETISEISDNKGGKKGSTRVAVVKVNPEKSKHLETATMLIFGQPVDFVNLRTEKYTENSRIPEITIGSPKEDALRRDITINSMFYNINDNKVEDLLEYGISDLKNKIIRTPINAEVTFKDDPLRILRCVRFATRFEFNISKEIIEVASRKEIKLALRDKVSNERVKKELRSMFIGRNPYMAIQLLYQMDNLEDILKVTTFKISELENKEITNPIYNNILVNSFICDLIVKRDLFKFRDTAVNLLYNDGKELEDTLIKSLVESVITDEFLSNLFTMCLSQPFYKFEGKDKKEVVTASLLIIKKSLMSPNDEINLIRLFNSCLEDLRALIHSNTYDRLKVGVILRKITSKNLLCFLFYSLAQDYFESVNDLSKKDLDYDILINSFISQKELIKNIISKYLDFIRFVVSENIFRVDELKPLFNGTEIISEFKVKGPKIGELTHQCILFQIQYPNISKDELKSRLIDWRDSN